MYRSSNYSCIGPLTCYGEQFLDGVVIFGGELEAGDFGAIAHPAQSSTRSWGVKLRYAPITSRAVQYRLCLGRAVRHAYYRSIPTSNLSP